MGGGERQRKTEREEREKGEREKEERGVREVECSAKAYSIG